MKGFAAMVARLDAEAEIRLGDSLFYDANGIAANDPVSGFVTDPFENAIAGIDTPLDQVGQRRRLEISKSIVPVPTKQDRVRSNHAMLAGDTWQVTNWRVYRGGRAWIMDLAKVKA